MYDSWTLNNAMIEKKKVMVIITGAAKLVTLVVNIERRSWSSTQ
jgi:hypothetical protein